MTTSATENPTTRVEDLMLRDVDPSALIEEMLGAGFSSPLAEAVTFGLHIKEATDKGLTVADAVRAFCLTDPCDVARIVGADSEGNPLEDTAPATLETALTFINSWQGL